jgi:hypothetical protein
VVCPPSRRRVRDMGFVNAERRRWIGRWAGPVADYVGQECEKAMDALSVLSEVACPIPPDGRVEPRIAEVLVRRAEHGSMLARDIQDGMAPAIGEAPTVAELRAALTSNPCFVEGPRWRYRLGRRYVPATH